jgi:hypothetical protein
MSTNIIQFEICNVLLGLGLGVHGFGSPRATTGQTNSIGIEY